MRTADKLDSIETIDAARLQHGEAAEKHSAVDARSQRRVVPRAVRRALRLIMDMVKHAVIWHQQSVTLERTNCTNGNTMSSILQNCQEFPYFTKTNFTIITRDVTNSHASQLNPQMPNFPKLDTSRSRQ